MQQNKTAETLTTTATNVLTSSTTESSSSNIKDECTNNGTVNSMPATILVPSNLGTQQHSTAQVVTLQQLQNFLPMSKFSYNYNLQIELIIFLIISYWSRI